MQRAVCQHEISAERAAALVCLVVGLGGLPGLGGCYGGGASSDHGDPQAGAGGAGPVFGDSTSDPTRGPDDCDGMDCGYSEPCEGAFVTPPGQCCPVCETEGEPSVVDPGGKPVTEMDPPSVEPPPACAGSIPADGASCDMNADSACSDGGFTCRCQCECASNQGSGEVVCSEPCVWLCAFQDESWVSLGGAQVDVDCTTSPATLTAAVDLTFHASATGAGETTFDLQPLRVQLEKSMEGFDCAAPDVPVPAMIGPLAPGATKSETFTIGPIPCGDPGSANARFDTCRFGYCESPGEAWIMVGAQATTGDHTSTANARLEELPSGARIPVSCGGG